MRLELPFPPQQLSPNFKRRNHWRRYFDHTKSYRNTCGILGKVFGKPETFNLLVTLHPKNRRMDDDNIIAMFKAGRDGLADAWGVNDREFNFTYRVGEPVKNGLVVITEMRGQIIDEVV